MTDKTLVDAVDAVGARLRVVLHDHATMRILPPLSTAGLEAAEATR